MKVMIFVAVLGMACAIGGCATKNHGRVTPLSSMEKTSLNCREIDIEISKVQSFMTQISTNSEIDGRSVLGFLGDFGIGNAMERSAAEKSAKQRLEELNALRVERNCP
jgi:hypothetical protein